MAVLKVKNIVNDSMADVHVDDNILPELNKYNYVIDKYSKKPYREVITGDTQKRKYFLDREIFGCTYKDGTFVYHKNGDPLDCRLNNLYNRKSDITLNSISSSGFHWPSNIRSFLNFIENRSDTPEGDLCSAFLAIADIKKYNKKRLDIVVDPDPYEQYKKMEIYPTLKKLLHKYFDWDGALNITKNATFVVKAVVDNSAAILQTKEEIKPVEQISPLVVSKAEPTPEIEYEFYDEYPASTVVGRGTTTDLTRIKRELYGLSFKEPTRIVELLQDNKIFPTEVIIKILRERGAATVQF